LKRTTRHDTTFTSIDVEIHAATLITEGKLLVKKRISVVVPPLSHDTNGSNQDLRINTLLTNQLLDSKLLKTSLNMLGIASMDPAGTFFITSIIIPIAEKVIANFGRTLSPQEKLESSLLATTILVKTWGMIKPYRKTKNKR